METATFLNVLQNNNKHGFSMKSTNQHIIIFTIKYNLDGCMHPQASTPAQQPLEQEQMYFTKAIEAEQISAL